MLPLYRDHALGHSDIDPQSIIYTAFISFGLLLESALRDCNHETILLSLYQLQDLAPNVMARKSEVRHTYDVARRREAQNLFQVRSS